MQRNPFLDTILERQEITVRQEHGGAWHVRWASGECQAFDAARDAYHEAVRSLKVAPDRWQPVVIADH